jgi:hypothetical protein
MLANERECACGVGRLNSTGRLVARFGALCFAGLLSAAVSQAAPVPASTTATSADSIAVIQARRDLLFKRMLANPADLDAAFEYATLSAQAGDLEAAVSTLERMLIFSPGLPRIQLELGALYYRLGAFEISRGYFVDATAGPEVPPEVRERVTVFLSAIERANKRHFWSTRVFSGVKWETNANAGPNSGDVDLRGITFTLEDSATANADHSLVLSANTHYAYVLGKQGDRIEADLVLYSSSHEEQKQVDLQVAEMTLGPSFSLKRFGLGNAVLGTYGIANLILLGEDPYFYTGGAGVRLAAKPTAGTRVDIKSEARRQWYETSEERPNAKDRDGDEYRNSVALAWQVASWLQLSAGGMYNDRDVEAEWLDRIEYGAYGAVGLALGSPFGELPWILSMAGGYTWRDYEDPDTTINLTDPQKDREYWARAGLAVPLTSWLALTSQVEYRNVKSNYDTATYDNLAATVGLSGRF